MERQDVRRLLRELELRQDTGPAHFHLFLYSGCRCGDLVDLIVPFNWAACMARFATERQQAKVGTVAAAVRRAFNLTLKQPPVATKGVPR